MIKKMKDASVYFIGGTFGQGGSGWIIAIITATLTALGAFCVGLLLENYKRHRDKQALAASLAAEIETILQLLDELHFQDLLGDFRDTLNEIDQASAPRLTVPADAMDFPTTVYEKTVDRLGLLSTTAATSVVRFYNSLTGFRVGLRMLFSDGAYAVEQRLSLVDYLKKTLATEEPKTRHLIELLRKEASASWLASLWDHIS